MTTQQRKAPSVHHRPQLLLPWLHPMGLTGMVELACLCRARVVGLLVGALEARKRALGSWVMDMQEWVARMELGQVG